MSAQQAPGVPRRRSGAGSGAAGNAVRVVVEGYVRPQPDGTVLATSTATLVTTAGGARILVDPGSNRALLLARLTALGVRPEDVDYVFLTHGHLDHALNAALFPNAKVVDAETVVDGERITALAGRIPGTDVEVLPTPGHEPGHASLVVPTPAGTVVVAGDVFWWEEGQPATLDPEREDPYARDMAQLRRSREAVLARADWIVPGHGAMQRVARRPRAKRDG